MRDSKELMECTQNGKSCVREQDLHMRRRRGDTGVRHWGNHTGEKLDRMWGMTKVRQGTE